MFIFHDHNMDHVFLHININRHTKASNNADGRKTEVNFCVDLVRVVIVCLLRRILIRKRKRFASMQLLSLRVKDVLRASFFIEVEVVLPTNYHKYFVNNKIVRQGGPVCDVSQGYDLLRYLYLSTMKRVCSVTFTFISQGSRNNEVHIIFQILHLHLPSSTYFP